MSGFEIAPDEDAGLFGLSPLAKESAIVILPVRWQATVSYHGGTDRAPDAVLKASHQLDLDHHIYGDLYQKGIYLAHDDAALKSIYELSQKTYGLAQASRRLEDRAHLQHEVNQASEAVNQLVYDHAKKWLDQGKLCGVLGGDHSSPFGLIKAIAEKQKAFSILHVDAHLDLRKSYEGFTYSHASIFYNVTQKIPEVKSLTQVGIRDYSKDERSYRESVKGSVFYSDTLYARKAHGESFLSIADDIIDSLLPDVYVSFDIDGLAPDLCPHTGTPVPGGLAFEEACFLLRKLASSGRKVVGFDLCEVGVSPHSDYDANVGARILYHLCLSALKSK